MEQFVVTPGYEELHSILTEIFKNNKRIEVIMDRRIIEDKNKYKHVRMSFQ